MTKSNKKATENVANDAPQEKGALNLGNLKLNRKVIVILSTVVVIAGLFIGFKFLYLDPKEEKAQAGICYYKLGNYKEAIKMLEGFTPQGDKGVSPQFIAALANCYAADGQLDKAVDTFKKAASEADNAATSPQYLIEAGLLLESQKKNDEALKIYEQIKKDYPQSSLVAPQQMQGGYVSAIDKYIERVSK